MQKYSNYDQKFVVHIISVRSYRCTFENIKERRSVNRERSFLQKNVVDYCTPPFPVPLKSPVFRRRSQSVVQSDVMKRDECHGHDRLKSSVSQKYLYTGMPVQ